MPRPCKHTDCIPGCHHCNLSLTRPDYRRAWGEPDPPGWVYPVAPLASGWRGAISEKPWHYKASVCFAHLNTPDLAELTVSLWQCQTVEPYLLIIDTGSPPEVLDRLEKLRTENVEIHHVRAHAYPHSSGPVCVALDLAHALCRTKYLLHAHADVFPRRRDLLAHYLSLCSEQTPVVGHEMSPRKGTDRWKGTVSHTCTMLYMPTIRKIGATWSMERFYDLEGWPTVQTMGWPDTESMFDRCLRDAGIKPMLLGTEPNYARHQTEFFDHARSYTGLKMTPADPKWATAQQYTQEAMTAARCRLRAWQKFPDAKPCGCAEEAMKGEAVRNHAEGIIP